MKNDVIDARGMRCPWPVLRLARALRERGAPLTIVADDPIAPQEIAIFADERGLIVEPCETPIGSGFVLICGKGCGNQEASAKA
jgi:tRNA 2-thiouridine synthesizing protein A